MPYLATLLIAASLAFGSAGASAQSDLLAAVFGRGVAAQDAGNHADAAGAFEEALALLEREGLAQSPDAGLVTAHLAESLLALGNPAADRTSDRALQLLRPASDPNPYLNLAFRLADLRLRQGRNGEAATLAEGMLGRASEAGVPESTLAGAIEASAAIFRQAGHHDKADAAIARALDLTGSDPLASSLRGLARVFRARFARREGRYADMEKEIALGLVDLELSGPGGAESMGAMLLLRAELRYDEGRYRAALNETDAAYRKIVEANATEAVWREAITLRIRLLERLDRLNDALSLADEMVATIRDRHGENAIKTVAARLGRVEILLRGLRFDEARGELAALGPLRGSSAAPELRATYELRRADIALVEGDPNGALAAAESAYRTIETSFPGVAASLLEPLRLRAEAANAFDDQDFAELAHRELIELSERAYGPRHPEHAADLTAFALWLANRRRLAEAETIQRRIVELTEASYGSDSAKFAAALSNLAVSIVAFPSRAAEAAPLFERALDITERLGDLPHRAAMLRFNLAAAIVLMGRYQEALDLIEQAREIYAALPPPARRKLFMFDAAAMQALAALGRLGEALETGVRMANTATVETADDLQSFVSGLTELARIANVAGDAELGIAASRRAMRETARLGHESGGAYRLSAAALIGNAWQLANR